MDREVIQTANAPAAVGPYSQAVKAGGLLFVSGQIPIDPRTGEIERGDVARQTRRALKNMCAVLDAAGLSTSDVLKVTVCIRDIESFALMNEAYAEFFTASPPARLCFAPAALPKDVDVEVDCIALFGVPR